MDLAVAETATEVVSDPGTPACEQLVALASCERRAEERCTAASLHVLHASVRPGCRVAVVDMSQMGAQIESERPLRPGACVHVRVVAEEWTAAVAARVLRCVVWTLDPRLGVLYRAALRFEEHCAGVHGTRRG